MKTLLLQPIRLGLVATLCCLFFHNPVQAQPIDYQDFSDVSELVLNGMAQQAGTALRVTRLADTGGCEAGAGSAWFMTPQPVTGGFETTFTFQISNSSGVDNGADGLTFTLQNNDALAIGDGGGGIGYGSMPNSVTAEFDTFQNPEDPNNNHIGLNVGGDLTSLATFDPVEDLEDGTVYTVQVIYDAGTGVMTVFFEGGLALSEVIDLGTALGGNEAYVGFTSGVAGGCADHDILSWTFNPTTRCEIDLAVSDEVVFAGGALDVSMFLKHNRPQTVERSFFLEIEDARGRVLFRRTTSKKTLRYLDALKRDWRMRLPDNLQPGRYRLVVGMDGMMQGRALAKSKFRVEHDPASKGALPVVETVDGAWLEVEAAPAAMELPQEYGLAQNYPNPFNPSTRISYMLPEANEVTLRVYDLLGQEVATLVNAYKEAGAYEVVFDATALPSGVYFYRLEAGNQVRNRTMQLMK